MMKTTSKRIPLFALVASSLLHASYSQAATLTWDSLDTNNGSSIEPGDGTWNTTASNTVWNNGASNIAWAAANQAVFGGVDGLYSVTIGETFSAQKILFANSGYTLSSPTTARTITLTSAGGSGQQPGIAIAKDAIATIGSNVTVRGSSTTYIGGDNSTEAGTLNIEGTGAVVRSQNAGNSVVIDGFGTIVNVKTGGLLATATGTPTGSIAVGQFANSNATLNVDGGTVLVANSGSLQVGNVGQGTVTLTSGNITIGTASAGGVSFGLNVGNVGINVLDLNGGLLTTPIVRKGSGTASTAIFNFNGGTLMASAAKTNFMEGLTAANVKAGGAIIDTQGFNIRIAQSLLNEGGGLTKKGTGTLTLSGMNTYAGDTLVESGTLQLSTEGSSASDISTATGATAGILVAATGTQHVSFGDLNLNSGSTFVIDHGTMAISEMTAPLAVDNFSISTGNTLLVNGPVFPGISYPLVTWTTDGPADVSGFTQVVSNGLAGTLSIENKTLKVVFSEPTPISWNTGDGTWDTSSAIWLDQALAPTIYVDSSVGVLFGDAAGVVGSPTVTLNTTVTPFGVKMLSTSHDYSITGNGTIAGAAGLTLDANNLRTLTIATANTYTGETKILGGTLRLGDGGITGSLMPASPINSELGTTFTVNQSDTVTQGIDFGLIGGAGGFSQTGAGNTVLTSVNTFTGSIAITSGSLEISGGGLLGSGTYAGDIAIASGSSLLYASTGTQTLSGIISGLGSLAKTGGSVLTLSNANTYSGSTTFSGTLNLGNQSALASTSMISMPDGTSILRPTVDGIAINAPIQLGGSGTTGQINAPSSGAAGASHTLTINQPISGSGNLRLFGSAGVNTNATIHINAQCTYAGRTDLHTAGNVNSGQNLFVKIGTNNALPPTTVLTLDGGTGGGSGRTVAFDLGGFNQTLAGLASITTLTARNQRVTNSGALAVLTIHSDVDSKFGGAGPSSTFNGNPVNPTAMIIGNIALTKAGPAKFTLAGNHQYSGNTTISEGILSLEASNNFNDASTISIAADGATLDLNFIGSEMVNQLIIGNIPQAIGTYGAIGSGAMFEIPQITGAGTLVIAPAGYTGWASTNAGGQLSGLDFDGDGMPNGVEYFMNAPAGFTTNPGLNASNIVTWPNGNNIPASQYGIQFVVQTTSDLSSWTDVPVGDLITNTDGPGGILSYQLTGEPRRFVRLKVTPN